MNKEIEFFGDVLDEIGGGNGAIKKDWLAFTRAIDKAKVEFNMTEDEAIAFITKDWDFPKRKRGE